MKFSDLFSFLDLPSVFLIVFSGTRLLVLDLDLLLFDRPLDFEEGL